MKKVSDWFNIEKDVEKTQDKVEKVFAKWYKDNLTITHGSGRNVKEIFGFPYTSSSQDEDGDFFAAIWNCQAEAYLNSDPQWKFWYLAIGVNGEILAVFERENTGNFDNLEIMIGRI